MTELLHDEARLTDLVQAAAAPLTATSTVHCTILSTHADDNDVLCQEITH